LELRQLLSVRKDIVSYRTDFKLLKVLNFYVLQLTTTTVRIKSSIHQEMFQILP